MLEKAKAKGVYTRLHQGDLTGRLDLAEQSYDAIICVGTFTCGHVGLEAFDKLIRITKPGGLLCFTVRDQAWEEDNYRIAMDKLEKSGIWKCLEEKTADYIQQDGTSCNVCIYEKGV